MLELVKYPNDVLTARAALLSREEILAEETSILIKDMMELAEYMGALGLAAPQVGIGKAIAIYRTPQKPEFKVLINPAIIKRAGSKVYSYGEGCLSCPEKRFDVKRFKSIVIEFNDREGNTSRIRTKTKMEAFVIQHELDHLRGIVLPEAGTEVN